MKTIWKNMIVFMAIVLMATVMTMAIPTRSADQKAAPAINQSADQKTVIGESRSASAAEAVTPSTQDSSSISNTFGPYSGRNSDQPDYVIRS